MRTSGPEAEILRRTPWSRIRGQNSVYNNSWRLLAMANQRAMCERKQLQFSPRYGQAWKKFTIKSVSEFFHAAE